MYKLLSVLLFISLKVLNAAQSMNDLISSDNKAVGRVTFVDKTGQENYCTAWLTSFGCVLTTTQYISQIIATPTESGPWLTFNDPSLTDNSGNTEANRYRIIKNTIQLSNSSDMKGDDWALFQVERNSLDNQSVFSKQQTCFRLTDITLLPYSELSINITGYSVEASSSKNRGLSTAVKQITYSNSLYTDEKSVSKDNPDNRGNFLTYLPLVPTSDNYKGAVVFSTQTNLALGLHNGSDQQINYGTGFKNTLLQQHLIKISSPANSDNCKVIYVDSQYPPSNFLGRGEIFQPFRQLEDAIKLTSIDTNTVINIVSGNYTQYGFAFPKAPKGKKVIFKALSGKVNVGKVAPK